jgi:hypothetical protein
MAVRKSSCLKSKMMGSQAGGTGDGFAAIMTQFFIDGYTGSQPTDADAAATGTKLVTWSINDQGDGNATYGGTWAAPTNVGLLARTIAENLVGTAVASGSIGWIRIRKQGDTGAIDTSKVKPRLDLSIGVSGADILIGDTTIVSGTQYPFGPLKLTGV